VMGPILAPFKILGFSILKHPIRNFLLLLL
ncbi:unnamed protein product, partial [marine sediment metagenome]